MAQIRFYKVDVLPSELVPNAIYFVLEGDYADTYVTDAAGNAKAVGNTQMIEELTVHINAGTF